jgi:hypothetical protein
MEENLTRYDLVKAKGAGWELKTGGNIVAKAATKAEILDDLQGTLRRAGNGEGTVRIDNETGGIEEERTFPRSKDPRQSPG